MTTSCHPCGAELSAAVRRTGASRCPACTRGLTGARNEHSVLFSLADLATAGGPALSVAAPPRRVVARPEGSGLIDLRAMKTPGSVAVAPPRFTSPTPAPLPAAPTPAASPSTRPLYAVVAALMFGLAGLTTFVLSEPAPAPPPSPRHTVPAPVLLAGPAPEAPAQPDTPELELLAEQPAAPVKPADSTHRRKPARPAPASATRPQVAAPDRPAAPDDDSTMKCLLGTGACKVDRPVAPTPAAPEPVAINTLPERLSDTDITAGTAPAKASATTTCARLAKADERVRIKLSIAGPTGTVLHATPEDDGGNPALASCCAAQLQKASFKKVQRPQMGALVTLKF